MLNNTILIIDVETTGFSHSKDYIVEVGLVELNLDTGKKLVVFDELIAPPMELEQLAQIWIVKQGYIDLMDIVFAEGIEHHRRQIQGLLDLYDGATAYNNTFDFGMMDAHGFEMPKKLGCPMKLSRDVCKMQATRKGAGKYKNPSAVEAYNYFFPGSEHVSKHRGADDAWNEADVVKKLYDLGIFKL